MAKKYSPGALAKDLLRGVGDIDVAVAGPEGRANVLSSMEAGELSSIDAAGSNQRQPVQEQLDEKQRVLDHLRLERENKNATRKDRVVQAALWRKYHVEQRIPGRELAWPIRLLVFIVSAGLDFTIFASSFAYVLREADFGLQWWIGGLLGLITFVVGVFIAHDLKDRALSHAQASILRDIENGKIEVAEGDEKRLVVGHHSWWVLISTSLLFLAFCIFGALLRISGSGDHPFQVIIFQGLIPFVIVLVEFYVHNPVGERLLEPSKRERNLSAEIAKLHKRLAVIEERIALIKATVTNKYDVERNILSVEQDDIGLSDSTRRRSDLGEAS